jgi:hypothetical protein
MDARGKPKCNSIISFTDDRTNFTVLDLTPPGLEFTISSIRVERSTNYTTNAVGMRCVWLKTECVFLALLSKKSLKILKSAKSKSLYRRRTDNTMAKRKRKNTIYKQYKADIIILSLNVTCFRHDVAEHLLIWREATIAHSLISFKVAI